VHAPARIKEIVDRSRRRLTSRTEYQRCQAKTEDRLVQTFVHVFIFQMHFGKRKRIAKKKQSHLAMSALTSDAEKDNELQKPRIYKSIRSTKTIVEGTVFPIF
jgi:hypothetical protein